jgi:hypothetical protein
MRGRTSKGEQHYAAKLSKERADDIRARYKAGRPRYGGNGPALQAEYGICKSTLHRVLRGDRWA